VSVARQDDRVVLSLTGRLDAAACGRLWRSTVHAAEAARGRALVLDLHAVTFCDMAGAAFLIAIETAHDGAGEVTAASPHVEELLHRARAAAAHAPAPAPAAPFSLRELLTLSLSSVAGGVAFLGEAAVALVRAPRRRRMLRPLELARYAEHAGIRSLPLVIMLGYLMGLILAFQSAVPMRRFGADIYVASLVSVALLRELGPLLSAVVLAGRTGSAFAAEIGTMKVNEEIDALATMGLDPMTMLVLPRMFAAVLVMPVMTLVLDVAGLLGMATVMRGFGFPLVTVAHQVQLLSTVGDLVGGLFKAMCFGAAVAAVGCRAGLATGVGPRAVGLSATAAVVGGIVATIVLDGMFALIFYRLGL
jgi:phospholipid/cholesterol/gamma-HCH transport system permease protein